MTTLLKLENAALLLALCVAYGASGAGWMPLAILFFAPDLSFLAYLIGPRAGAWTYNIAHSWIGPTLLATGGLAFDDRTVLSVGLIWGAHVAFDRMLGYGLKHESGFRDTHLGQIGRD